MHLLQLNPFREALKKISSHNAYQSFSANVNWILKNELGEKHRDFLSYPLSFLPWKY